MKPLLPIAIAGCLAACSTEPTVNDRFAENVSQVRDVPAEQIAPRATAATPNQAAGPSPYLGLWTGVEGMYLTVSPGATPASVSLEMQYDLDHKVEGTGRLVGQTIVFERGGKTWTLRPTTGSATGLKYLAAKTDCLTVAPGEGYCRE